ncbi:MAG TPA: RING finger domain-containing protein [Candidatus Bathyarchaeia archaeon]|nr:RING finger domain-containing protein [Candidatus Bathyarchaeia archaeon]
MKKIDRILLITFAVFNQIMIITCKILTVTYYTKAQVVNYQSNTSLNDWQWESSYIIWLVLGIFIAAIALLIYIFSRFKRTKNTSLLETKKKEGEQEISRNEVKAITKKKILVRSVKKIPSNSLCRICKLDIHENQSALQCPNCSALFHSEHIQEWLVNKDECPVCKHILKK